MERPAQMPVVLPSPGCLLLAIPVLAILAVFVAYVVLFASGLTGRPPTGPRVAIAFDACPEAQAVVRARAVQMGLGDVREEERARGFVVVATLPAASGVAESIPDTLAHRGLLEVRALATGERLLGSEGVADAGVRLDMTMSPTTLVSLQPDAARALLAHFREDPDGRYAIVLDGVQVAEWSNRKSLGPGELEIPPDAADDQARMELAAARGVVLGSGPLPCAVSVASVTERASGSAP